MARVRVLDPTAPAPEERPDPGPDAGSIEGRLIGIRYDRTWKSFEWVIDEWGAELERAGARLRTWCAGNRIGEAGERTRHELEAFSEEVDLALLGLGN
jgi:hypothetical protein